MAAEIDTRIDNHPRRPRDIERCPLAQPVWLVHRLYANRSPFGVRGGGSR